ncbi:MAG: hypothetical protein ACXWQ4_15355 [Bdellovibrio sp.]
MSKKIICIFIVLNNLGCSLEASISDLISKNDPVIDLNRQDPDFIPGEYITTSEGTPGFEVKAVFGEISEKQETTLDGTGWQIEGTFYE